MKKFKHLACLLLAAVVVFGCTKYDDTELKNSVSDLQSRVEKLEEWCKTTNTQISALQGIVTALEAKDYVTGVTPITEGSETTGYTITFSKSPTVTIKNGANGKDGKDGVDGKTPLIGVKKDTDNLYYWTVKTGTAEATWLLDADGKKVSAAGVSPVMSVAADTDGKLYWKVDGEWLMNGTDKVPATGSKGEDGADGEDGKDGDSIFKKDGIDLTDPNNVTFTLNGEDDTKITFPRTSTMKVFDSFDNFKIATLDVATPLTLALNIKDANYKAIKAELTSTAGLTTAIKTRAQGTPWQVSITAPTFKADGTVDVQPVVSITAKDATEGDIALLKVTVIDSKGDEHASTRVLFYSNVKDAESVSIDDNSVVIGGKVTLVATVLPAEAIQTVTWTSSDEAIATINATTGEVEGKAAGEVTITATCTSNTAVTGTCKVTVEEKPDYIEVNGIKVAIGNLVADGTNSCKIGKDTDAGLYFQHTSLVGWSSTGNDPVIVVKPADCTVTTWKNDWQGSLTENTVKGVGDPCKYYLKETWRLPTKEDFNTLFGNATDWADATDWYWTVISSATHISDLSFPAAGVRYPDGSLATNLSSGSYWSSDMKNAYNAYYLVFNSSDLKLNFDTDGASGVSVRCVRD